jgi:cytochrome c
MWGEVIGPASAPTGASRALANATSRHAGRARSDLHRFLLVISLLLTALLAGCGGANSGANAPLIPGANPNAGVTDFRHYGCVSCHVIPGVPGANGFVGPPLTSLGLREYIGGKLPNTPANLMLWIRHPQHVEPGIDMPEMGVTKTDARDMAAYLENLRS